MKYFLLFIIILNSAFAHVSYDEVEENEFEYQVSLEVVESIYLNEIQGQATCLDDYISREKSLKKWLIWAPPLGVVKIPLGIISGGAISSLIMPAAKTGWDGLAYFLAGGMIGGALSAAQVIGVSVVNGVRFARNRNMLALIVESHQEELVITKRLDRFLRQYKKRYNDNELDLRTFASLVRSYDEQMILCDGSMRGTQDNAKLKHRLARKKELFEQIYQDTAMLGD